LINDQNQEWLRRHFTARRVGGDSSRTRVAATGTAATQAAAQQKVKQAEVKYQDQPKGPQRCDGCVQFQPPNACKIVEGQISPNGWCEIFAAKT
jgi:hypothetical protein